MKKLLTVLLIIIYSPLLFSQTKIYWVDDGTNKIQRANIDGSNVEDLVTSGLDRPYAIALDVSNDKMYWTDFGTDKIQRANLDGTNIEDLVTTGLSLPFGIALNVSNNKMYWVDGITKKIQRANLDGSNVEDLITSDLSLPYGIALDLLNNKLYWTDIGTDKIQRSNLDGSNIEDLIISGLDAPVFLVLDVPNNKMYWTDEVTNKIQRANLDGSNIEDLVTSGLMSPYGIALDLPNNMMYWVDAGTKKIQRANLDGSNVEDFITSGLNTPFGLAIDVSNALPVEITTFQVSSNKNNVHLQWSTASETNNQGFEIQHSVDGFTWKKIGFVKGKENTTQTNHYHFRHTPLQSGIQYYRLEQFDFDGKSEILPVQTIIIQRGENSEIEIFPNPVDNFLTIKNAEGRGKMVDISGRIVKEFLLENGEITTIVTNDLQKGIYHLTITKKNGEQVMKRFLK